MSILFDGINKITCVCKFRDAGDFVYSVVLAGCFYIKIRIECIEVLGI